MTDYQPRVTTGWKCGTETDLVLLLVVGVGHERARELGAALAGDDGTAVGRLCDEQRRAVALAATLDRARRELIELYAAVEVDPAHSTLVTYEDLVLRELIAREVVSAESRPKLHVNVGTHMILLVSVPNDAALLEDRACLPNLCIKCVTEM